MGFLIGMQIRIYCKYINKVVICAKDIQIDRAIPNFGDSMWLKWNWSKKKEYLRGRPDEISRDRMERIGGETPPKQKDTKQK